LKYSSRLPRDIQPTRLAELIGGTRIRYDLTESNPTRAGFEYPVDSILAGFQDERMLRYDPESLGLPEARQAVADLHGVSADRVLLTASTSEAYAWLFKLLCDSGDEILIPRPSYPLFEMLAGLESVETRTYPLHHGHGWFIDVPALRHAITPRTRAIVVVNPNNPTGNYVKPEEHAALEAICAEHDLALISDEVFGDYTLSGVRHSLAGGRAFVLNGLSKLVGLPQMKLGWIIAPGSSERLELIADTYLSVGTPVQYALPALLAARIPVQMQIRARLECNLRALKLAIRDTPVSVLDVEAGWNAILRVPAIRTEEEWVSLLLTEHQTLVHPGFFYDFDSEPWLIVSLLTRPEIFDEGVRRIVSAVSG
jgi:aspartate/methionine/tyrosine aminotransferase